MNRAGLGRWHGEGNIKGPLAREMWENNSCCEALRTPITAKGAFRTVKKYWTTIFFSFFSLCFLPLLFSLLVDFVSVALCFEFY